MMNYRIVVLRDFFEICDNIFSCEWYAASRRKVAKAATKFRQLVGRGRIAVCGFDEGQM